MNILVLGAASGIGQQVVKDLAGSGCNLLLSYNEKKPVADPAECVQLDASCFLSVENFIEKGIEKFESVDGIINLPGNLILKPPHLATEQEFQSTIDINLKSAFAVIRAAGKLLKNTSIVLMSTSATKVGLANHELIASAKSGIEGLAKSAAKTYGRKNIRINTVSPGLIDTPLAAKIVNNPIALQASKKMHVLGRIGTPKHISNMIMFLVNKENDWVTGHDFVIDGGLSSTK